MAVVVSKADADEHVLFGPTHFSENGMHTVCGERMARPYLWVPCRLDEEVTCDRCKRLSAVPRLRR